MHKLSLQRKNKPCIKDIKCPETTSINYIHMILGEKQAIEFYPLIIQSIH